MASNETTEVGVLQEAERLFAPFNAGGAALKMVDTDGTAFNLGLVDSFVPLRAQKSAGGGWDVWLLWRELGYFTSHDVHLIKLIDLSGVGAELQFTEEGGRQHTVQPLADAADRAKWAEWQKIKAADPEYQVRAAGSLADAQHRAGL